MSNHKCRYCTYSVAIEKDSIWCNVKDTGKSGNQVTNINKCKDFVFNEIDVYNLEKKYIPRKKRQTKKYKQIDFNF